MTNILPYLPEKEILAAFNSAAGNEIVSGKFDHPESSAALAANTFGFFVNGVHPMPALPLWPQMSKFHEVRLEAEMRFPWSGGRHPWLDAIAVSIDSLVGIESKRFEPFRGSKSAQFAEAYWRDVWGDRMSGYQALRDDLQSGTIKFKHLDAAQLVKHALGLLTQRKLRQPYLLYFFAEPEMFSDGRRVSEATHRLHRHEIEIFADCVKGDAVTFAAISYDDLLADWAQRNGLKYHAAQIRKHFLT